MVKSWVLLGYVGAGNMGDDLMARTFLTQFSPEALHQMVILGRSRERPTFLQSFPCRYYRASLWSFAKTLMGSQGIIVVGGTHFHDSFDDKDWRRFCIKLVILTVIFGAYRLLGKKVLQVGIGIGPLRRSLAKFITKQSLKFSTYTIVRDPVSLELCRDLGARRVYEGRDLAFLEVLNRGGPDPRQPDGVLGISPTTLANINSDIKGIDQVFWTLTAAAIARLFQEKKLKSVRLFAFNVSGGLSDDRDLCQLIAGKLQNLGVPVSVILYDGQIGQFESSIKECSHFIAFRFHSAIVAALNNRKLILVPYHRKVSDLVDQFDMSNQFVLDPGQKTEKMLAAEIDRVLDNIDAAKQPSIDQGGLKTMISEALSLLRDAGAPIRDTPRQNPAKTIPQSQNVI